MQNDEMQKKKTKKQNYKITLSSFLTGKICGVSMGKHRDWHPSLPSKLAPQQIKSRMQKAMKQNLIDHLQEYHKDSLCVYWFTERF